MRSDHEIVAIGENNIFMNRQTYINGKIVIYNPNSYADAPRTANEGGELTIINRVRGYDTSGPTIMFKGIWESDSNTNNNTDSSNYPWRMATIHATETNHYGGNLVFSTKLGHSTEVWHRAPEERMRITSDGKVGIGTSNPERKLHVSSGEEGGPRIRIQSTSSGQDPVLEFQDSDNNLLYLYKNGINNSIYLTGGINVLNLTPYANPRTAVEGGDLTLINMCPDESPGHESTGPTLMFKGIWQGDYRNNANSALYPYNYRLASIHATEKSGYGGQLRFSTKASAGGYTADLTERMIITNTGYVGIGTSTPGFPLEVNGTAPTVSVNVHYRYVSSGGQYGTASSASSVSAKFNGRIWITDVIYNSSDSRIKTNIVDVPDNLALEQLRSIPCRYYEYIDKLSRGTEQTIGFIAQEVKSVFPMAVKQQKQIIPNVYKIINCTWTEKEDKFIMSSSDLSDVSGVNYKFYVSNVSDGSDEKEIEIKGNSDNTFTFDTQYISVFCYGSEVNDFHTLDKHTLYTLNFSATQEIDRIQQQHIIEIETLKSENIELKEKLTELTNKIKNATTFEDLKNSL